MSDSYAEVITTFPLFTGYTMHGAQRLLHAGEVQELSNGTVLFKEGDPPDFALLVLKGKLQVFVERDGKEISLTESAPGTIVGELGVLCGLNRSASIRVLEDSVILNWPARKFQGLLLGDTYLAHRIFGKALRTVIEKEQALIASLAEAKKSAS